MSDTPLTPQATPAAPAPSAFVLSDTQFTALLAAAKAGSPFAVVASDAKAVGEDVIARMEQVIADAKGAANKTHGAAKALQADVRANWPILLVAAMSALALAMHFVKVFGFGG